MAFQNTGGNIFGQPNTNPTPSPFGGNAFGGGTTPNPAPGGLFGVPIQAPLTGSGIFGGANNPPTSAASQTGGSMFGGGMNNATSTHTSGASGGLFSGANAPNQPTSTTATGLFGGSKPSTPAPSFGTGPFGGGGSTTAPTTGSIFGMPSSSSTSANNTTSTPAPSTNSPFTATTAFSLPKPGDTTTHSTKPAASGFFSQPSVSNTTPTAAPTVGSGLFSLPSKPAASATPDNLSSSSTPGNTFGGGGIFGSSTTPVASSLGGSKEAQATSTAPAGTGLFGSLSGNKDAEKKEPAPPAASPFNLFGAAKPAEKKEDVTASKDGEKKGNSIAPAPASTTATSSTSIAIPPPSMLRGKSLEEIVNRWTADLETNVREFNKFAAEVSVWDRVLIENGNNIAALHSHVQASERQQNDINEALGQIEQNQKELASTLETYEKFSQEILGGQSGGLRTLDTGPADTERDKNYMLATDLHTHLDDLSGSLTQMIDSVNGLSFVSKPTDSVEDPMSQISQILSSHLESLQWIDTAVREVESKTTEVEKRIKESGHSLSGPKSRAFGLNR